MKYVKGSLFDAPYGSALVHSCNCQGVWGAGIALEFKKRFPEAYSLYQQACMKSNPIGTSQVTGCNGHIIGNLFVSKRYGWAKDTEDEILDNTRKALVHLADQIRPMRLQVNMPKINAGLFNVPWEKTENLIKFYLEPSTIGVTVWEL